MAVITIIGILVALGVGAGYSVVSSLRVSATENAMRTIQKVLQEQWNQVIEEAKQEDISPAIVALANNDSQLARVLWIKLRLYEAFPQNYAEIRTAMASSQPGPPVVPGIYGSAGGQLGYWIPKRKNMATYFAALPLMDKPGHDTNTESIACLLMSLSVTRGRAKLDLANLAGFVADTDGDGVQELVDKWGNPLHFQRWWGPNPLMPPGASAPTPPPLNNWWVMTTLQGGNGPGAPTVSPWSELTQLNPRASGPKEKFGDPLDPDGLMQMGPPGQPWYSSFNGTKFSQLINHPFPAYKLKSGTTPQPYYVPYVFSIGPNDPTAPHFDTNGSPYYDTNTYIHGFRLRVGSQ
jgi:type II secretory pathway pseudopilin PulG